MDSPITGVLETYELLETILLAAPMKQLFVLKRVSKTWREIIERSQSLRMKMFLLANAAPLRPKPTNAQNYNWHQYDLGLKLNPFLLAKCGAKAHADEHEDSLLIQFPAEFSLFGNSTPANLSVTIDICGTLEDSPLSQSSDIWTEMLLTQPPVTALSYEVYHQEVLPHESDRYCTIYRRTGLTLSDVCKFDLQMHQEHLSRTGTEYVGSCFEFLLGPMQNEAGKATPSYNQGNASGSVEGGCVCNLLPSLLAE